MKKLLLSTFLALLAISNFIVVNAQYHFIPSLNQSAAGCGYFALANAHAVQQLFNEGKAINEENIKALAYESLVNHYKPFYEDLYNSLSTEEKKQFDNDFLKYAESQPDLLTTEDAYSLQNGESTFFTMLSNEHNQLKNAYAIECIADQKQPNIIRITECLQNDTYGDFIGTIKNQERAIIHFLYNLGSYNSGHWVYVGVIKEQGSMPYIIHLNSTNNNSFYTSEDFKLVIKHIVNCIGNQKPLLIPTDNQPDAIQTQEQIDIEKAIKASLEESDAQQMQNEEDVIYKKQMAEQEAADLQLAQKLQEQDDFAYSTIIAQREENDCTSDATIALALEQEENTQQIVEEDADFAYALSLADEYDF
ncbi:hypothetical protein EKK58_04900 [Candidatus Dependentiae bacterium]|nr:MAG: hypothetical protein EKK58_04900 [Candidatus Dependentiae bacterium]